MTADSGAVPDGYGFVPFRSRRPWLGGDLQTIRNVVVPVSPAVAGAASRRMAFEMPDGSGDRLTGTLTEPFRPGERRPLVVLIHGLGGWEDSAYMVESTRYFLDRGHAVLRLNLRGSAPTRPHCSQLYHAGRDEDLAAALDRLADDPAAASGLVLVGFSLGGNMLLKFLAQKAGGYPVRAAVSVSAPIDLAATAERFLQPRNWLYHRWLLRYVKADALGTRGLDPRDAQIIHSARTIVEFDDRFVAPRNGFDGARDYYRRCSAIRFLDGVSTPVLLIHALDDPWIPAAAYRGFDWRRNPCLTALLSPSGGHVGFHDADGSWHNRMAGRFIDEF